MVKNNMLVKVRQEKGNLSYLSIAVNRQKNFQHVSHCVVSDNGSIQDKNTCCYVDNKGNLIHVDIHVNRVTGNPEKREFKNFA